jgi:hypothetical protein
LFASLYVKLLYDSDDDFRAYQVSTVLLFIGGTLYLIPQIFAIEVTSQSWLSGISTFLTSTSNPGWMAPILVVSLLGYGVIGGLIFQQVAIRGRRFGEKHEEATTAVAA